MTRSFMTEDEHVAAFERRLLHLATLQQPHQHTETEQAAYDRCQTMFPELTPHRRHNWAEQVAHSPALRNFYFRDRGPADEVAYLAGEPFPYEPADHSDGR